MGDQQNERTVVEQAIYFCIESVLQLATRSVAAGVNRAVTYGPSILHRCTDKCTNLLLWIFPFTIGEEDLMAIPRPEENLQRTFVGVLSSETAKKLQAMFKKNFCPEIVPLARGTELPPECRLVICCLPKNTRQMYLDGDTVLTKLITDAGSLQAMVLMITFGEKKIPWETMYDDSIYGSVLQQGQNLYMRGRSQSSLLREQTRRGVSESVSLVTVGNCPSKYQLRFMKKFVEDAFIDRE